MWNQPPAKASAVAAGILQIALHHRVAAQHELAHRRTVGRHGFMRRGVHHRRFLDHRRDHALARHEGGLLVDRQVVQAGLPEADGRGAVGLGQPIQMCDGEAHRLHLRDHGRGRRGAAGGDLHRLREVRAGPSPGHGSASTAPPARRTCGSRHDRRWRRRSAPARPGAGRHACRPPGSPPRCRSSRCSGTSAASTDRRSAATSSKVSALAQALRYAPR